MIAKKIAIAFSLAAIAALPNAYAQGGRGGPPGPPPTPKAAAKFDITGYWVSLVTEDWRYRQFTPPKGDFTSVPLNPAGKKVMEAWDAAKDEAAGDACKAYGAAGLMRIPTRLHITWQDDNTLKLETDAGKQTRTFHFGGPEGAGGDLQGYSRATWDYPVSLINTFFGGLDFGFTLPPPPGGSLKVSTSKLKGGYLRKNGVPSSARTTMTEYFDRLEVPGGDTYLLVTTEVTDPEYLTQLFWTSTHFKKENDASGWSPTPCSAR
ncbi:MAG: hypothetical protein ABL967_11235 [Bryobacteraceae bacterium]